MSTPAQRLKMAKSILDFEARRKNGKLVVYTLPPEDGGGTYEVAGINDRYHPIEARRLADLIEAGKHAQAEKEAIEIIASYTDIAANWTTIPAIESYLRDCVFNRGARGAARILQLAVEVKDDGYVGPETRAAIEESGKQPQQLLLNLRKAREQYERVVAKRDEDSIFWEGLVARWNKALKAAEGFGFEVGPQAAPPVVAAAGAAPPVPPVAPQTAAGSNTTFDAAKAVIAAATGVVGSSSPIGVLAPVILPALGALIERLTNSASSGTPASAEGSQPQSPVALRAMRLGSQGPLVKAWQAFLTGQDLDPGGQDGEFGDKTDAATKAFQAAHGLTADGVVGRQTIQKAMDLGFELIEEPASDNTGSNFPPRPNFPPLLSTASRQAVFGKIDYVSAPRPDNPEAIRILGSWEADNIVSVPIPQLKKVPGVSAQSMRFHKLAADQLKGLWAEWETAGLLDRIITYDGAYVPRFIRGSRTVLSNHAFGTAFDINADFNRLGARPKLVGVRGSVRELVPIANRWGFYWGGHFGSRPDGMHFEVAIPTQVPVG